MIIRCTLSAEERVEASDIVTATLENTTWGLTKIATNIKISYDKSFGAPWQVIVGENFSCSLDHELLIYMYNGSLSILAWKDDKDATDLLLLLIILSKSSVEGKFSCNYFLIN